VLSEDLRGFAVLVLVVGDDHHAAYADITHPSCHRARKPARST
jgi:hypothetical protein